MSSQQKVKDVKWVQVSQPPRWTTYLFPAIGIFSPSVNSQPEPGTDIVATIQGLRGLASVVVLATHIARAFDYPLFFPQDNPDTPPRILQLPIVRLVGQGRIGVPIFAFVTGFVCALKPLRLLRNGPDGQGAGLKSIVKSASTRAPRMVLPAALATVISCAVCASGWYEAANHAENWFVRYDSPVRKDNIFEELGRLMQAILDTWTTGDNVYDRHQWAMQPLLMVAFYTYVLLLVVTRMKFAFRLGVYIFMMTYWWANCQKGSGKCKTGTSNNSKEDFESLTYPERNVRFIKCLGSSYCGLVVARPLPRTTRTTSALAILLDRTIDHTGRPLYWLLSW